MATIERALKSNTAGDLFVDDTCIDCDTCRWMAPETFDRAGSRSRVHAQPSTAETRSRALLALVACPTASIGSRSKAGVKDAAVAFPIPLEDDGPVFHCGYHDERSYGATPWLIQRADGNVLVDVPRFAMPLVHRIEALGGVHSIFLTHRDDVADHRRWAEHFGAPRILHARDVSSDTRDCERIWSGNELLELAPDLTAIPTPGHTQGSACLLFARKYLFTGDHLAADDDDPTRLIVFEDACWYSMDEQLRSVARLLEHEFEWVLPGHGRRAHLDKAEMKRALAAI